LIRIYFPLLTVPGNDFEFYRRKGAEAAAKLLTRLLHYVFPAALAKDPPRLGDEYLSGSCVLRMTLQL
jgi:hypothetical protein